MNKASSLLILVSLSLSTLAPLQAQQQRPAADDVVRISTNLVQVDAVVTDKDGNPIKNLTTTDFEVRQDGKPQKIVFVSYVNTDIREPPAALKNPDKITPVVPPPMPTRPANATRILTFVVDDGNCTASRVGMLAAHDALEKFVKEEMRPDDLVAIYQTSAGSSLMQQLTSDKTQLLNVVRKVRWYPPRGLCSNQGGGDFFDSAKSSSNGKPGGSFESGRDRENRNQIETRERNNQ